MLVQYRDLREQNRRSWNEVVPAHHSHHRDLAGFLRQGGLTIFPEERELLGELYGRTLVHLMCNTGQDTLSLARLGARVTGVDISEAAIDIARRLSSESGISGQFEHMDVYDWLARARSAGRRFDRVFCSYGAICWLPDLAAWARDVAGVLTPGGRFVVVDFHPVSNMFDQRWRLVASYPSGGSILALHGVDDYVGESGGGLTPSGYLGGIRDFKNAQPCYLFRWGVGEVVTALADAQLVIEALREYSYVNGERPFEDMRELPGWRMAPPEGRPAIPLMYGIAARKIAEERL
jgi:SAM-dependent methyltransferase